MKLIYIRHDIPTCNQGNCYNKATYLIIDNVTECYFCYKCFLKNVTTKINQCNEYITKKDKLIKIFEKETKKNGK